MERCKPSQMFIFLAGTGQHLHCLKDLQVVSSEPYITQWKTRYPTHLAQKGQRGAAPIAFLVSKDLTHHLLAFFYRVIIYLLLW